MLATHTTFKHYVLFRQIFLDDFLYIIQINQIGFNRYLSATIFSATASAILIPSTAADSMPPA